MHILLVEDHLPLAKSLAQCFEQQGHSLDYASNGEQAIELFKQGHFDLVVLDVMLPHQSGYDVCQTLRDSGVDTPILMLTARDTLDDKLHGFAVGADDYLTKPFAVEELLARCQVLIRRQQQRQQSRIHLGDLVIDTQRQRVSRAGVELDLLPLSYRIVLVLAQAYPAVVNNSRLRQLIWPDEEVDNETLRSQIYLLRQKIDKPFSRPLIKTLHGVGYTLDIAPS